MSADSAKTVYEAIVPGTRVRSKYSEGYGVVQEYFTASGEPGTTDALMVKWESGMRSGIAVASVDVVVLLEPELAKAIVNSATIGVTRKESHMILKAFGHPYDESAMS